MLVGEERFPKGQHKIPRRPLSVDDVSNGDASCDVETLFSSSRHQADPCVSRVLGGWGGVGWGCCGGGGRTLCLQKFDLKPSVQLEGEQYTHTHTHTIMTEIQRKIRTWAQSEISYSRLYKIRTYIYI